MPYQRRATAPGRRRQPTAKKFQARAGGKRTTQFKSAWGALTMNWNGAMRFGGPIIQPAGAQEITRIGGIKITYRMVGGNTGSLANSICVGLLKLNAGEAAVVNDPLNPQGQVRRVFAKETWTDISLHAPTLAQHVVRGMLTLTPGQELWLVYLGARVLGSASPVLTYFMEWSQRETSIDG